MDRWLGLPGLSSLLSMQYEIVSIFSVQIVTESEMKSATLG